MGASWKESFEDEEDMSIGCGRPGCRGVRDGVVSNVACPGREGSCWGSVLPLDLALGGDVSGLGL